VNFFRRIPTYVITIHQRHRRTDRQTTGDRNTALCTKVHRAEKTVEARIMQFSPYSSPGPLVFAGYLSSINSKGSSRAGASNKGQVGEISSFLSSSVNISKMVSDTAKVTIMTNMKSHMGFPLTPRSMTLDDLELL